MNVTLPAFLVTITTLQLSGLSCRHIFYTLSSPLCVFCRQWRVLSGFLCHRGESLQHQKARPAGPDVFISDARAKWSVSLCRYRAGSSDQRGNSVWCWSCALRFHGIASRIDVIVKYIFSSVRTSTYPSLRYLYANIDALLNLFSGYTGMLW